MAVAPSRAEETPLSEVQSVSGLYPIRLVYTAGGLWTAIWTFTGSPPT